MVVNPPLELLQGHNIRLKGGWTAQLQRFNDYFIADLLIRASITMLPRQWKLFRKTFIYLNITTIADIVTACRQFITKGAYTGIKSYESINKWTCQQHFTSIAHRKLWANCMINITQQGSRQLGQPLGAWTAALLRH